MPTSSFDKSSKLKTKREIESFLDIISKEPDPFNIPQEIRWKTSPEGQREAEEYILKFLEKWKAEEN